MIDLKLFNTLTLQKELFTPINPPQVGLYTCGPTVYNYAHLGNLRTFLFEDLLKRTLEYNDFQVVHVMNITDVGHLTGDMDMGEDKLEIGARREGKTAWDIAEFYTEAFKKDLQQLNIIEPTTWCKATDHITEQIYLISELEAKGYAYIISDGVYFDTSKVEEYNKLSHLPLTELREGARVEVNDEKRNATDFALWKFSYAGGRAFDAGLDNVSARRMMEWPSPWGFGFPGWHVECSAMSLKYLSDRLDIHCGGIDHINIHHTNEIAQSESATGHKFFNFWMHCAFLNIAGGKKMAKSEDNFLTLTSALVDKGINPLSYRYACLQTHYRKTMEYSEESLQSAENGLQHLYNQVRALVTTGAQVGLVDESFKQKFIACVNDDLNSAQALALLPELLKSDLTPEDKLVTIIDFDRVLGLGFAQILTPDELPQNIQELMVERIRAKAEKNWSESDRLRSEIEVLGYTVEDGRDGMRVIKK